MISTSVVVFAVGAVLGLFMLVRWFMKKDAPRGIVYLHGLAGAAGIVLLLLFVNQHPDRFPLVSIILFVVAALGGFYLFFSDIRKKPHPLGIALLHGLLAVSGFLALLLFILA